MALRNKIEILMKSDFYRLQIYYDQRKFAAVIISAGFVEAILLGINN